MPGESKSRREFLCRDDLWETFKRMAEESGFSRDVLINEAMKRFAKARGFGADLKRKPGREDSGLFQTSVTTRRTAAPAPEPDASAPSLYLSFNGQRFAVDAREDFVIGRGTTGCHLTIKDANVSRRHAAIAFRDGSYFLQDLGSTNGVEFDGEQVDHKRIEEGDVFYICDYELRFTYQS